ncbi:MAG: L-lactate transport [Gemmatimonadetes bacterium]|nr:L-lactate transport [Gemmatimonadota bacterium]
MHWAQSYDPLGNAFLSTIVAAVPVVILLGCIASGRVKAHVAALIGLASAVIIAVGVLGMPASAAAAAVGMGAAYGLRPIGWIVLNIIFLYQLTKEHGAFDQMQAGIGTVSADRRIQLVLIAFSLGAFFEGAAGFGTPVAITGALLIGLGFSPLQASGLSLIANTAPVAFGAMGTPILALQGVTGIDLLTLSKMVGRQVPVFAVAIPFWLIFAYDGWRGVRETWPTLLVAGLSFAIPQFVMSNVHGPYLVDVVAGATSIIAVTAFVRMREGGARGPSTRGPLKPWIPWMLLCAFVFAWGLAPVKKALNAIYAPQIHVPFLDGVVQRVPPVVAAVQAEPAIFSFNILSLTGTAILIAALLGGLVLGYSFRKMASMYGRTLVIVWPSLVTIVAMLAIGYLTRYSGLDAILGLAFARTGVFYPLFGTMLGWLGVALTGSDTASNVLFGSLQKITATQLGLSPVLMAAANSSGGVMGKMIDMQSIVVASTATRWYGHEGKILRFVFVHSLILALLVGVLALLQAYVAPFTAMVPR